MKRSRKRKASRPGPGRLGSRSASEKPPELGVSFRNPTLSRSALPLLGSVLSVVAGLTLFFVWNEDLWWYLASGRFVVESWGFPDSDPFLYTANASTRFPSHSWLWSVTLELIRAVLGIPGMVVFGGLVAMGTIALIFCSARVDRWGLANSAFCALVVASAAERLSLKSELASWLLLVIFFYLLERTERWTWKEVALLAALEWLWANLHAGYPLGIAVVVAYVAGAWVPRLLLRRKWEGPPPIPLWTPVVLAVAPLITPQLRERFRLLEASSDITVSGLSGGGGLSVSLNELQGTFAVSDPTYSRFYLLGLGLGLLCLALAPRSRYRLARLFFVIGMAILAYTAIRHVTGLMIAVALVSLRSLGERQAMVSRSQETAAGWNRVYPSLAVAWGLVLGLATLGLWTNARALEAGQSSGQPFTLSPLSTCPGAADYVLEQNLPGPIFNDMILGGYLTYRLFPEHQLFADNRVLAPRIQNEYMKISTSEKIWRRAEQEYGFRTVILSHLGVPADTALRSILARDPKWRQVYIDPLAVVFVKLPSAARKLERPDDDGQAPYVVAERSWQLPRRLSRLFFRTDVDQLLHQYFAVLGRLQQTAPLIDLASTAVAQRPEDSVLYRHRGSALMMNRRFDEGIDDLETAIALDPSHPTNHFTIALAFRDSGRLAEAVAALDRALDLDPGNPRYIDMKRRLERVTAGRGAARR